MTFRVDTIISNYWGTSTGRSNRWWNLRGLWHDNVLTNNFAETTLLCEEFEAFEVKSPE